MMPDGWTEWSGGMMPPELRLSTKVLTLSRNGTRRKRPVVAATLNWFWSRGRSGRDIIAYKAVTSLNGGAA